MRLAQLLLIGAVFTVFMLSAAAFAEEEKSGNPVVMVNTNLGSFTVELYEKEAPITVANFLSYVEKKFYDGTTFHRVKPGFVIQGGGFTPDMMKKPTEKPITNEATNGLKNLKYTLSMARTPDINGATSQFFVNLVDNTALDHRGESPDKYGYAVFGKVIEGTETIDKIAAARTTKKDMYSDVPVKSVIIKSIRRIDVDEKL